MARQSPAGARGLHLTPFLEGTGAPWNDRKRRSSFDGIGAEAQAGDILRAGVESLATWLRINLEFFTSLSGLSPRQLVITGGGARNDLANEIKAAMTGLPLALPDVGEAAGLGAALVAGIAVGAYADADEAARLPDITWRTVAPDPALVTAYASLLPAMKAALERGSQ
jgi:sugar (pentulose or hexulose) kinase